MSYCTRLIWIENESPLGVVFHRTPILADGSCGSPRWWDVSTGTWSSMFTAARCVRPLQRPLSLVDSSSQAFAVPIDVASDPLAAASLYVLKSDGSIASLYRTLDNADLVSRATMNATQSV